MKVWITKYALTHGIFEVEAEVCTGNGYNGHMIRQLEPKTRYGNVYYHGKGCNWHETEDGAKAQAEKMREKKVASMLKQIKKLQAMKF